MESLRRADIPAPLPDTPQSEMVGWAIDIGLASSSGMGLVPVSSLEVKAWADGMALSLSPWEFAVLRRMSRAYVDGANANRAPFEPALTANLVMTAGHVRERRVKKMMEGG